VGIGEGGRFRPHVDGARDLGPVDLERITLEDETQLEVVHELQRIGPRLHRAVLVAERRRSPADDIEEHPAARGALQAQAACRHREARHPGTQRIHRRRASRRNDKGRDQERDTRPGSPHPTSKSMPRG
jgi:hypothetical protein